MRILLTGATGFIGSHTMEALVHAGYQVRPFVRDVKKLEKVMQLHDINVEDVFVGDVTDKQAVHEALHGCDGVVHLAAVISLLKKDRDQVFETNLNGTKNVIGQSVEEGITHITHISSISAIYDPHAHHLSGDLPPRQSASPYGSSKAAAESYVRDLQKAGHAINILYPTAVIGPFDFQPSEPHEGLITLLKQATIITSTGIQYVDVRDIAKAIVGMLDNEVTGKRITLGGRYYSWQHLAETLEALTGRHLHKLHVPGPVLSCAGYTGDLLAKVGLVSHWVNSEALQYATHWVRTDDKEFYSNLDMDYRNGDETLEDTMFSLFEEGFLSKEEIGEMVVSHHYHP